MARPQSAVRAAIGTVAESQRNAGATTPQCRDIRRREHSRKMEVRQCASNARTARAPQPTWIDRNQRQPYDGLLTEHIGFAQSLIEPVQRSQNAKPKNTSVAMSHKQVFFRSRAREKLLRGASQLADVVRMRLGTKSKSALIQKKWGLPRVCNDGATIAKAFDLPDAEEYLGMMLRQAAEKLVKVSVMARARRPPWRMRYLPTLCATLFSRLRRQSSCSVGTKCGV
jgi:hypothetical protein